MPYVVIAPSYMVYAENYDTLLQTHIDSGADITLLYHSVDNAKEAFLNCDILNLNRQKGVESIEKNRGSAKNRNIFMDTYIMKKELFIELIHKARKTSSMITLPQIVNASCRALDIRGVSHKGFFATITDFGRACFNTRTCLSWTLELTESFQSGMADLYQNKRLLPYSIF